MCVVAKSLYKIILLIAVSFKYLLYLTCMVSFVSVISVDKTKYIFKTLIV